MHEFVGHGGIMTAMLTCGRFLLTGGSDGKVCSMRTSARSVCVPDNPCSSHLVGVSLVPPSLSPPLTLSHPRPCASPRCCHRADPSVGDAAGRRRRVPSRRRRHQRDAEASAGDVLPRRQHRRRRHARGRRRRRGLLRVCVTAFVVTRPVLRTAASFVSLTRVCLCLCCDDGVCCVQRCRSPWSCLAIAASCCA